MRVRKLSGSHDHCDSECPPYCVSPASGIGPDERFDRYSGTVVTITELISPT